MNKEYKSVMATDEEINAFDKKQLETLLNDLKDIHKFTGFKDGSFRYELTKYQATILLDCIEYLEHNWNELKRVLKEMYIHTQYTGYLDIIYKMQELEEGGNNEDN